MAILPEIFAAIASAIWPVIAALALASLTNDARRLVQLLKGN